MASKTFGKVVLQRSWKSLVIKSLVFEYTYHVAAEFVSPSNPDRINVIMLGAHSRARVNNKFSTFPEKRNRTKVCEISLPINMPAAMKPATYPTVSCTMTSEVLELNVSTVQRHKQ
jgi:hypothetical protein